MSGGWIYTPEQAHDRILALEWLLAEARDLAEVLDRDEHMDRGIGRYYANFPWTVRCPESTTILEHVLPCVFEPDHEGQHWTGYTVGAWALKW